MQYTFKGKSSFTSVGVYPKASLKKARKHRDDIFKKIDRGEHPLAEKRKSKEKQRQQKKIREKPLEK